MRADRVDIMPHRERLDRERYGRPVLLPELDEDRQMLAGIFRAEPLHGREGMVGGAVDVEAHEIKQALPDDDLHLLGREELHVGPDENRHVRLAGLDPTQDRDCLLVEEAIAILPDLHAGGFVLIHEIGRGNLVDDLCRDIQAHMLLRNPRTAIAGAEDAIRPAGGGKRQVHGSQDVEHVTLGKS